MSVSCVLAVDDSEACQFIIRFAIESYDPDIEVLQAYDGQEALEMLDSADSYPQIIFLDINMPRMNAHEFLEAYSKRPEKKATVVIMLTSLSQKQDIEKSKAYECVKHHIEKPLRIDHMDEVCDLIS